MTDDTKDILNRLEKARQKRHKDYPDESACLNEMLQISERLRELGWEYAIYCPKDGSMFLSIEFGSTGIFHCRYLGKYPRGGYFVAEGGDLWPSRPIMWKPLEEKQTGED